jgi:hypothetical protein
MSPRGRGRFPVVPAVLAAAALTLSGCSPVDRALGIEANTAVLSNRPVLTAEQASAVAERALGEAERADALRTAKAARAAYTDLALRLAAPTYVVEKVLAPTTNDSEDVLAPSVALSRVVVTSGRAFPRLLIAIGKPEGAGAPQLSVLRTPDVRTPYRVATRADLLPGAVLPETAASSRGAAVLPADVSGLVSTPTKALADYARLLQTGRSAGTSFAPDIVVRSVRENAAGQAKGVRAVATYSQVHRPQAQGVHVVRTTDGGALVVAAIDRFDRFTVRKGAGTIKPPAAYTALSRGVAKITKRAEVTTVQVVVMVLPPHGGGPARVVGFRELPVSVTAS